MVRESVQFVARLGGCFSYALPLRERHFSMVWVRADSRLIDKVEIEINGYKEFAADVYALDWLIQHYDVMPVDEGVLVPLTPIIEEHLRGRGVWREERGFFRMVIKISFKEGHRPELVGELVLIDQPFSRCDPLARVQYMGERK